MTRSLLTLLALTACQAATVYPSRDVIWAEALARFDKDGDGLLSPAEFEAVRDPRHRGIEFEGFDTNRDGAISPAELDAKISSHEPRPLVDTRLPHSVRGPKSAQNKSAREGRIP